jgi:hypothetical protein
MGCCEHKTVAGQELSATPSIHYNPPDESFKDLSINSSYSMFLTHVRPSPRGLIEASFITREDSSRTKPKQVPN